MSDSSVQNQQPVTYVVERILEKRFKSGKPEYRVKWQGYSTNDSTWEAIAKLKKYAQMIDDFECKNTAKKKTDSSSSSAERTTTKKLKGIVDKKAPQRSSSSSQQKKQQDTSSDSSSMVRSAVKQQRGRPPTSKKAPPTSDSSSSEAKKAPTKKTRMMSSSDDERPPPTKTTKTSTTKKKEVTKISSSPSSTSLERSRSQRANTKVATSKSNKDKVAQNTTNDTAAKQGSFALGDKPKDIVNIRKDVRNQKVEFLISWSNRRHGKVPLPLWVTDQQLKERAPEILCEFLLKKIKWPKKV